MRGRLVARSNPLFPRHCEAIQRIVKTIHFFRHCESLPLARAKQSKQNQNRLPRICYADSRNDGKVCESTPYLTVARTLESLLFCHCGDFQITPTSSLRGESMIRQSNPNKIKFNPFFYRLLRCTHFVRAPRNDESMYPTRHCEKMSVANFRGNPKK